MPYELQSKLTDFLQKETYSIKNEKEKVYSNIRFISTTNKNPNNEIEQKKLKKDLYYRRIHRGRLILFNLFSKRTPSFMIFIKFFNFIFDYMAKTF